MLFVLEQRPQKSDDKDEIQIPKIDRGQRRCLGDEIVSPIPRQHFGKKSGEEGDEEREENDKRHKSDENGDGKDTFLVRGNIRGHKALGK